MVLLFVPKHQIESLIFDKIVLPCGVTIDAKSR